nr:hypothetical protein GCM10020063_100320 [Dactylosporangium thailandense]
MSTADRLRRKSRLDGLDEAGQDVELRSRSPADEAATRAHDELAVVERREARPTAVRRTYQVLA